MFRKLNKKRNKRMRCIISRLKFKLYYIFKFGFIPANVGELWDLYEESEEYWMHGYSLLDAFNDVYNITKPDKVELQILIVLASRKHLNKNTELIKLKKNYLF